VEVNSPPSFFEGVIQAHKPTTWRTINTDFTGGEASANKKHTLHLLKLSVNQPLEHLLEVEPRFQQILKTHVPLLKDDLSSNIRICASSASPTTFISSPVRLIPSSVNITPRYITSSSSPATVVEPAGSIHTFTNTMLADMYPGASSAVPPLVSETDDSSSSSERFLSYASSDDEQDTPNKQHSPSSEGTRKCQCIGGCSSPGCLCFKSLESCGGDCECSDCSNPLNEEADLASSSPSSPSESLIFFPSSYLTPLSPPTFSSPILTSACGEVLSLLPNSCEYQCSPAQINNTIW